MNTSREAQREIISRRLALIRERRGLSQAAVASAFGKPQSWVAKLELGERRLLFFEAIGLIRFYKIPVELLDPRTSEGRFYTLLDSVSSDPFEPGDIGLDELELNLDDLPTC